MAAVVLAYIAQFFAVQVFNYKCIFNNITCAFLLF